MIGSLKNILVERLRKLLHDDSGVAMMITLAVFLFLYLLCSATYAFGTTIQEKIELQNACDAAVYSAALVEADGLSRMAMVNRALAWTYAQTVKHRMDYIVYKWLELTHKRFGEDMEACRDFNAEKSGLAYFLGEGRYRYTGAGKSHCDDGHHSEDLDGTKGSWFCGWTPGQGHSIRLGYFSKDDVTAANESLDVNRIYGGHIYYEDIQGYLRSIQAAFGQGVNNNYSPTANLESIIKNDDKVITALHSQLLSIPQKINSQMAEAAKITLKNNLPLDNFEEYRILFKAPTFVNPYANEDNGSMKFASVLAPFRNTEEDELEFLSACMKTSDFQKIFGDGIDQWFIRGSDETLTKDEITILPTSKDYFGDGIQRGYKSANRFEGTVDGIMRGHHLSFTSEPSTLKTSLYATRLAAVIGLLALHPQVGPVALMANIAEVIAAAGDFPSGIPAINIDQNNLDSIYNITQNNSDNLSDDDKKLSAKFEELEKRATDGDTEAAAQLLELETQILEEKSSKVSVVTENTTITYENSDFKPIQAKEDVETKEENDLLTITKTETEYTEVSRTTTDDGKVSVTYSMKKKITVTTKKVVTKETKESTRILIFEKEADIKMPSIENVKEEKNSNGSSTLTTVRYISEVSREQNKDGIFYVKYNVVEEIKTIEPYIEQSAFGGIDTIPDDIGSTGNDKENLTSDDYINKHSNSSVTLEPIASNFSSKKSSEDPIPSVSNDKGAFVEQCSKIKNNYGLVSEYHWGSMRWWCPKAVRFRKVWKWWIPCGYDVYHHFKIRPMLSCPHMSSNATKGSLTRADYGHNSCAIGLDEVAFANTHGSKNNFPGYGFIGYARIYGDDQEIYKPEFYNTPRIMPIKLSGRFFQERIQIMVAKRQKNPFWWMLGALDRNSRYKKEGNRSIMSMFSPASLDDSEYHSNWIVAVSAATAACRVRDNNDAIYNAYSPTYHQISSGDVDFPLAQCSGADEQGIILNSPIFEKVGTIEQQKDIQKLRDKRVGCPHYYEKNDIENRLKYSWNLCETDWNAVFVPVRYSSESYIATHGENRSGPVTQIEYTRVGSGSPLVTPQNFLSEISVDGLNILRGYMTNLSTGNNGANVGIWRFYHSGSETLFEIDNNFSAPTFKNFRDKTGNYDTSEMYQFKIQ